MILKRIWWRLNDKLKTTKLKLVHWMFDRNPEKYCWADCVRWAYSDSINPFTIESPEGCKIESIEHEHKLCYCGGWNNGVCYHSLPQGEKDKILAEINNEPDDLPF